MHIVHHYGDRLRRDNLSSISIFTWSCVTVTCKGTGEYTLQIIDPLCCFVARSVWSLVHTALPALPQCHLHFPRIHYQASAVCFAFIPQVAPHMKITHHIPWENSLSLNSMLLTISCSLTSWLPLCFVWNHSTLGAKSRKSQLPHKWPASLLRWSPLCSSPVLFNCWETGKGDWKSFLVIYSWFFHLIFMSFFSAIGIRNQICCRWGGRGQKSGFSSSEPSGWREEIDG